MEMKSDHRSKFSNLSNWKEEACYLLLLNSSSYNKTNRQSFTKTLVQVLLQWNDLIDWKLQVIAV